MNNSLTGTAISYQHRLQLRVYYGDTDAGGVVYYATYGHYFERGRTELLRALDCSPHVLMKNYHLLLPVISLNVRYHRPAYYEDQLTLVTELNMPTPLRLQYDYKLFRSKAPLVAAGSSPSERPAALTNSAAWELITSGRTVNVPVTAQTMRPRRLPAELMTQLRQAATRYCGSFHR